MPRRTYLALPVALAMWAAGCAAPVQTLRLDEPGAVLQLTGDIDETIHLETITRREDRGLEEERELSLRFGRRDRLVITGYAHDDTMTAGDGITLHLTVDATNFSSQDAECTVTFVDISQTRRPGPDATLRIREARGTIVCADLTGRHRDGTRTIDVEGAFHHRVEHEFGP